MVFWGRGFCAYCSNKNSQDCRLTTLNIKPLWLFLLIKYSDFVISDYPSISAEENFQGSHYVRTRPCHTPINK